MKIVKNDLSLEFISAFHFGPFLKKIPIKERGDLSGFKKVQYGYTVLLIGIKVTSVFITANSLGVKDFQKIVFNL